VSTGVTDEHIAFIFRFKQFVLLVVFASEDGSNGKCGWLEELMNG
jgi:hypothetical protein